jgi:hypothetical protein
MAYQLAFEKLAGYDPGRPGVTVPVELGLGQRSVACEARVDTGATYCVFARRLGEELGLDVETGIRQLIGTAMGAFTTYHHSVTLTTLGYAFDAVVCFAAAESFESNVLGSHGFLDRVRLGLVDYEGKLYLSRYDE